MKTHPIAWMVRPKDAPMFDERAIEIRLEDEAAGPFLRVTQCRDDDKKGITLDVEHLTPLIAALDAASNVADEIQADIDRAIKKAEEVENCDARDYPIKRLPEAKP